MTDDLTTFELTPLDPAHSHATADLLFAHTPDERYDDTSADQLIGRTVRCSVNGEHMTGTVTDAHVDDYGLHVHLDIPANTPD